MDETPPPRSASRAPALRVALGAAVVALAVFLVGRAITSRGGPVAESTPVFRNADPAVGYIGSAACAACHAEEHGTYRATRHARSVAPARPGGETLPATVQHASSGVGYALRAEGGALRVRASIPLANATEALGEHELRYAIGSGRRARAFAAEVDGFLVQAPVTWDAAGQGWVIAEGHDEAIHPHFTRPVDGQCARCHLGRFELAGIHRVRVIEPGIACESCHGPGALHAERWKGAEAPARGTAGAPDDTIVSLRRMNRAQQTDVCAQCHMDPYMTVAHPGEPLGSWRPGMPWDAVQSTFRPAEDSIAPHRFAGHVDGMRASACYTGSETLTCITCHDVHGAPAPAAQRVQANAQCVQCHEACARAAAEGRASLPPPADDDCVTCHMPRRADAPLHHARTEHRIAVPGSHAPPPPPGRGGSVTLEPLHPAAHLSAAVRERNLGLGYLQATARTPDVTIQRAYAGVARQALEAARTMDRAEDAAHVAALGLFEATQGVAPKTAARLQRALALDAARTTLAPETRAQVVSLLADYAIGARQFDVASDHLQELVATRRRAVDWLRVANLRRADDPAAAADAARTALRIFPIDPSVVFEAGAILGALGHAEEKARWDRIGQHLHARLSSPK